MNKNNSLGKSNIMILTSNFKNNAGANGICANNIRDALIELGHNVYMVGFSDECTENNNPFEVCFKYKRKTANSIVHVIARFVERLFHPLWDKKLVRLMCERATDIINSTKIDCVIAVYYPLETTITLSILKRNFDYITGINYELDSGIDGVQTTKRLTNYFKKNYISFMQKVYKKLDYCVAMKTHYDITHFYFHDYVEVVESDLPMLLPKKIKKVGKKDKKLLFVYMGLLDIQYRSPIFMLDLFAQLKRIDYELHVFSKGNCDEILLKYLKTNNHLHIHDYIDYKKVDGILEESDFLISIGNINSRSLPSKIIQYISFGKPIIHFKSQSYDISELYLMNYDNSIVIDSNNDLLENVDIVKKFIKNNAGKVIDFCDSEKNFYENVPSFSSNLICSLLNKPKKKK